MLHLFLLSLVVSFGVSLLMVRWEHLHARFTGDVASKGSHKVHASAVSRIGGLCIFVGWLVALATGAATGHLSGEKSLLWMVCLLPAFLGGLTEDFTKRMTPLMRLCTSFMSAGLAYFLLDARVTQVQLPGIDLLLEAPIVSFVFTLIAVGGVAHAINIIDGLNGLASGVCLIALLALAYVAFQVNDTQVFLMCVLGVGAIMGFRVWNYPSGRIFCGDGGAYFLGAYIAILGAILVHAHPGTATVKGVSPWFPLLLVLYPVWETLFSAWRRRMLSKRPASSADKLHMHTLVYKRYQPWWGLERGNGGKTRKRRNSDVSGAMILFASFSAMPAVLVWWDTSWLIFSALVYVIVYLVVYRRLVRFGAWTAKRPRKAGFSVARRVATLHRAAASRRTVREAGKSR